MSLLDPVGVDPEPDPVELDPLPLDPDVPEPLLFPVLPVGPVG